MRLQARKNLTFGSWAHQVTAFARGRCATVEPTRSSALKAIKASRARLKAISMPSLRLNAAWHSTMQDANSWSSPPHPTVAIQSFGTWLLLLNFVNGLEPGWSRCICVNGGFSSLRMCQTFAGHLLGGWFRQGSTLMLRPWRTGAIASTSMPPWKVRPLQGYQSSKPYLAQLTPVRLRSYSSC